MSIELKEEHRKEIEAHAEADYPHECCGFLVGRLAGPVTVAARIVRALNTRTDRPTNRFEIDPLELMRVDRAARNYGETVVGFYHSHPDAPARPSEYDREHGWPGYCYIIASVRTGKTVEILNWRLRDDRSAFEEDQIVVD